MGWIINWLMPDRPDRAASRAELMATAEERDQVLERLREADTEQRSRLSRGALEKRLQQLRKRGAPLRLKDLEREQARLARREQRATDAA